MRKKARGKRDLARTVDILGGGLVTEVRQGFAVLTVGFLGFVAQTHQGFLTALRPSPFYPEVNLFWGHSPSIRIARVFAKGAIRTAIAAEISDWEENLAGIGDRASFVAIAQRSCRG